MTHKRAPRVALITQFAVTLLALGWALPLLWTIAVAFRPPNEPLESGRIWFGSRLTGENFVTAWATAPFAAYYLTTIIVVVGILVVQLVTMTLAGFALARYRFPGNRLVVLLILLQVMIPSAALIVPNYRTIRELGLFDTRLALMVPFFATAFGTLLMRQTFRAIPRELDDAARVDGCRWWQLLWHVYMVNAVPALTAFSIVSVTTYWNEFFWPLIVTNSLEKRTLTVGLAVLTQTGEQGAQWSLVAAGTIIVIGPLLVLFIRFQQLFTESFVQSGIK
jgi:sn-glycerol 3-phosphate transport system permease protein